MSSPFLTGVQANNPTKYLGPNVSLTIIVMRNREPTGADIKQPNTGKYYSFGTLWLVGETSPGVPPITGARGDMWYLSYIAGNVAFWTPIADVINPSIETVSGDDGVSVGPDGAGNIDLTGNTVANATHTKPVFVVNNSPNSESVEVQLATVVSPTPANTNSCGISCFNSNQFQINTTSGMVSLIGSTSIAPLLTVTADTGGAISPDANGNISLIGSGPATGIVTAGSANQINTSVYRWVEPISNNWTPVVVGTTTPGVGTYIKNNGVYSRVGNTVFFSFDLEWSSHTGTGNMRVSGLPKRFTKANTNYPYTLLIENITLPANSIQVIFNGENNQTYGDVVSCIDNATTANVTMSTSGTLACFGFYFSDDA